MGRAALLYWAAGCLVCAGEAGLVGGQTTTTAPFVGEATATAPASTPVADASPPGSDSRPATTTQADSAPASTQADGPWKLASTLGDGAFRHDNEITQVVVLADGQRVLTSANDGTARLWNLATGRQLQCYRHGSHFVWDVKVLPDQQRFIATSGADANGAENLVVLWDLASARRLGEFRHSKMPFRLALDAAGQRAVAGDQSGQCILWDLATGKATDLRGRRNEAYTVALHDATGRVFGGYNDGGIQAWQLPDGELTVLRQAPDREHRDDQPADPADIGAVYTLLPSPDGSQLLVCCETGPRLIDAQTGEELWRAAVSSSYCGAWMSDGAAVALMTSSGQVNMLNARDGSVRWQAELPKGTHYALALSPDGRQVLCSSENLLCRFDAATGTRIFPPADQPVRHGGVRVVRAMPGGPLLIDASYSGGIRLLDRVTGDVCQAWLPEEQVQDLSLSADGAVLAAVTGEYDQRSIWVLDARKGTLIRKLDASNRSGDVLLSPDGALVVTSGYQGATVWRVASGEVLYHLEGSGSYGEQSIAVGPDMELAAFDNEKHLRLWNLQDGQEAQALAGQQLHEPKGCQFVGGAAPGLLAWDESRMFFWKRIDPPRTTLEAAEVAGLIARLDSDSFRDRQEATRRLAEAGESVLPAVRAAKPSSAEQASRLALVQSQIAQRGRYEAGGSMRLPGAPLVNASRDSQSQLQALVAQPGGNLWAALQGEMPKRRILLGDIHEGQPRLLQTLQPDSAPESICLDQDGVLVVGRRNGTISQYARK